MRKNQSGRCSGPPGGSGHSTNVWWFHKEQGDTVLEFSVGADTNVNPLLWQKGKKKVEKQKVLALAG